MGWTCFNKPKGQAVVDAVFPDKEWGGKDRRYRIEDAATKLNALYAVLAITDTESGQTYRMAAVALIQHNNTAGENFCYKEMTETMGPTVAECPPRILAQLTPLDEIPDHIVGGPELREWARDWRRRCEKATRPIRKGDRFRAQQGIRFGDGVTRQEFEALGGSRYRAEDGVQVQLPRRFVADMDRL